MLAGIAAAGWIAFFHPLAALAQPSFSQADNSIQAVMCQFAWTSSCPIAANNWFTTLQGMATTVYVALFTVELCMVGFQGALYKDNIAEFFQTFGFKVIMAAVFLAIIGNAQYIFPGVVHMFCDVATGTINGVGSSSGGCSEGAATGMPDLESTMFKWAWAFFVAADASKIADTAGAAATGWIAFGTGVPGISAAFLMGHENFQLFCLALGMTCVMAAAGIYLTFLLLTFEVQIVMAIGVIYLAFQGSRFTAQFAQGYMSYAVNVGTKFFAFYFMVVILDSIAKNADNSFGTTIGGLTGGALMPFGAGSILLVAATSPIPMIAIIISVLVAAIPNFAGSLLQGSSALSATAVMQNQAFQSMAGAGGQIGDDVARGVGKAMAQRGSKGGGGGGGGGDGQKAGAGYKEAAQTVPQADVTPSGTGQQPMAVPAGGGDGGSYRPLEQYSPKEIESMPADRLDGAARRGDYGKMDPAQKAAFGGRVQTLETYSPSQIKSMSSAQFNASAQKSSAPLSSDQRDAVATQMHPLQSYSPEQLHSLTPAQVEAAATKSDFNSLTSEQRSALMSNDDLRKAAAAGFGESYGKNFLAGLANQKPLDFSKAASGAAAAMKAGEQPPPAVQVRISNPDKL
jgi:hypothetical protein